MDPTETISKIESILDFDPVDGYPDPDDMIVALSEAQEVIESLLANIARGKPAPAPVKRDRFEAPASC